MLSLHRLSRPISLLVAVVAISSCAAMNANISQEVYDTTPAVTFLRENPGYDSPNVAAVYRGDRVVMLSRRADDWCQVQAVQSGKIGWMQSPLLSAVPISTPTYSIQASKVRLQETPQKDANSPEVLSRGEAVRKLSENQGGWWLVLVEKDQKLGWIPGTAVAKGEPAAAAPAPPAGPSEKGAAGAAASSHPAAKQLYYVATANLNLHSLPLVSSQVVKTLKFNDRVEKIDQSDSKWIKVRYPESGAQGWAQGMFLADASLKTPRVLPPRKRTPLKRPVCPKPGEPEKTQPEEVEPEVM